MIYYWKLYKVYLIIILSILLIICGIIYKNTIYDTQVILIEDNTAAEEVKEAVAKEEIATQLITVYVCGSVKTPSNVTLPLNSRVEDAVKLAGGLAENADPNSINMAQKLMDADMIYVPKKGEAAEGESKIMISPVGAKATGKLNINKATAAELDELPGIGPSTASKIIDYRTSKGGFKSIEELNDVSGIGDKKYDEIKSLITVN